MASPYPPRITLLLLVACLSHVSSGSSRNLKSLYHPPPTIFSYHHGALLEGDIPISITWYGNFTPTQKSIVSDFLLSLTPSSTAPSTPTPSVSRWWNTVNSYLLRAGKKRSHVLLASQLPDDYSMGKSLARSQVAELAARATPGRGGVAVVLTSEDVVVEGFCMSRCGLHGSGAPASSAPYVWVGNPVSQCPGQCAWPFHQPLYGPQTPPLVPPNGDVGVDGMVINLAALLSGVVTNPTGEGIFQGTREAPVEVAAACPGVYGKGAYPGYAGDLLVDGATGASYNANGEAGRRYLLPALFDAATSSCSTLV